MDKSMCKKRISSNHIRIALLLTLLFCFCISGAFTEQERVYAADRYGQTVYVSISHDGKFVPNGKGKTDSGYMTYIPVDLGVLDEERLADYGFGGWSHDVDGDGKVDTTLLTLFSYTLDVYNKNRTNKLKLTGSPGSMYMASGFWTNSDGYVWDDNLNYYVNGEYPLERPGWGATADTIGLNDGDFIDVAHYTSRSFFADPNAGFQYFADNGSITHEFETKVSEPITVEVVKTGAHDPDSQDTESYNTFTVAYPTEVYYSKTLYEDDASFDNAVLAGGNASCDLTFDEPGDHWLWTEGGHGTYEQLNIVNSPAIARVHVMCQDGAHKLEHIGGKNATCETSGIKECYKCTLCGTCFSDEDAEHRIDEIIPALGHEWEFDSVVSTPTCTQQGLTKHKCTRCGKERDIITSPKGHTWDHGEIKIEPTTTSEGEKVYTCLICGKTRTESIPKLSASTSGTGSTTSGGTGTSAGGTTQTGSTGAGSSSLGKGAPAEAADKILTSLKSDKDPAGTMFYPLNLKSSSQKKTSVKLTWSKVFGTKKYVLYGNKCGAKNKLKKLKTLASGKKSATIKKAGTKLKKGKYYKFVIVALDKDNKVISTSKMIHVATKGGKNGNPTKVKLTKPKSGKVSIKKGKKYKLNAKQVGKKVKKHRMLSYESLDTKVATVTKKGVITAKGKGKTKICIYTQNGISKDVIVTVK